MKKYLSILTSVLCLGLYSCEDSVEKVVYDPSVIISNYGFQSQRILDDNSQAQSFTIFAECDGAYEGEVKVKLIVDESALETYNQANATSYRLLPSDCYTLDAASKTMADRQTEFVLNYDIDKICALSGKYDYSDISDYAIPYVITSETAGLEADTVDGVNFILVNPVMKHKIVEKFRLEGPAADDLNVTQNGYSLLYKLIAEDDKWGSDYDFNLTITNTDGTELVEGVDYMLACSSENEAFGVGDTEISYTLSLLNSVISVLPADSRLKIKAELKSVENGYVLDGSGVSTVVFEPYPLWDKTGITADDLIWNSAGTNPNDHPLHLFDGNENTGWYCAYGKPRNTQSNTLVCEGIKSVNGVPCFVGVHFKEPLTIHAIRITPLKGDNAKRSRSFGFRFDWDMKAYDEVYTTVQEGGAYKSSIWKYTADWDKFLTEYFTFDRVILGIGGTNSNGGDKANDADAQAYYSEARWCTLNQDITTEYLQYWALSSKWEWPAINTDENNDGRGNDGSAAGAREIDIRLGGNPKIYIE